MQGGWESTSVMVNTYLQCLPMEAIRVGGGHPKEGKVFFRYSKHNVARRRLSFRKKMREDKKGWKKGDSFAPELSVDNFIDILDFLDI